jgi:hypothetical protein
MNPFSKMLCMSNLLHTMDNASQNICILGTLLSLLQRTEQHFYGIWRQNSDFSVRIKLSHLKSETNTLNSAMLHSKECSHHYTDITIGKTKTKISVTLRSTSVHKEWSEEWTNDRAWHTSSTV